MPHDLTKLEAARAYERREAATIPAGDRPAFHLTPPVGWMNDPNGFCFYDGLYHLFFQYYPYDTVWGPMHWGHATSADLLRWTYRPCALAPDTPADAAGCFSGSGVPLPDGRLLLIYTGVQPGAADGGRDAQMQCIAVGDGRDFAKDPANPVIPAGLLPAGFDTADFRDPKIWREGDRYYCVAACRHRQDQGSILLFESPDARRWKFVTVLDSSRDRLGKMWECPDFFPLGDTQVLLISPQEVCADPDGALHPGDVTAALLGRYDPATHAFARQAVQAVDDGLDFYAPQTTLAPDGRRILVGWMQCWAATRQGPRPHRWYGRMSLPRELFVRDGRLCQRPVREIETLWQAETRLTGVTVEAPAALPGIRGRCLDLSVTADAAANPGCRGFVLHFAEADGRFAEIRWDAQAGELLFDRSRCGTRQDLPHIRRVPAAPQAGRLTLRLILDKDCAELFVNGGERVLSALIDAPEQAAGISFAALGAPVRLDLVQHPLAPCPPAAMF